MNLSRVVMIPNSPGAGPATLEQPVVEPGGDAVNLKRFITVVIGAENQKQFDSAMLALGDSVHQIREGNALSLLDSIEERVIAAIRKA